MAGLRPIVCALDESEVSGRAAEAAAWLARELEAPLLLVHVFDPLGIPTRPRGEMLRLSITDEDVEAAARAAAHELLADAARRVSGVELATELVEGRPVPELQALAGSRRAALVVTGTAPRGGLDRILIGSVASELSAKAPCPVVVVPRGAELEGEGPVLAGYDGSEHSMRAARHAAALAARSGRDLVLVHVVGRAGEERVTFELELARELHLAGIRGLGDERARRALELNVHLALEEGDPVQVLAAVARERSAAMICTGTRGRNQLGTALLGSVSSGLVRAAGRPVGLVPSSAGSSP